MNILVIGATGYVGSAVTDALVEARHRVLGLARSEQSSALLRARGIAVARADFTDTDRLADFARDTDAVVWVATSNREDTDAPAVGALLQRMAGTGKTFVYTSGVWVHGETRGVADEDSPLVPAEVVAWRVGVERKVLGTSGIRAIVLRPGVVYGRGGGIPSMLSSSVLTHGAARFVGSGENHWAVVHVEDLAKLYGRALEAAPAAGVFVAVSDQSFSVVEIARAASAGAGAGGRVSSWPLAEARKELGSFADALALEQRFTSARAVRLLGWTPSGPSIIDELESGSYARREATTG